MMQVLAEGQEQLLMDAEVAWCQEHPEMPEAAKALHLHRRFSLNRNDRDLVDRTVAAVQALRAIRPRPLALVDQFYAWVMWNPNGTVECVPGFVGDQGIDTLLMGCDIEHMRGLNPYVATLRKQLGIVSGLRLYHYAFDREITLDDAENLISENLKTKTAQELFAFVGVAPTGDETVLGVMKKGGVGMPMAHPDADEIRQYLPFARRIESMKIPVMLRRFVRKEEIDPKDCGL